VAYKPESEPLDQFIMRKGGINACAARFTRCLARALVPTPPPAPPTGPSELARYWPPDPDLHPVEICIAQGAIEAGDDRGPRVGRHEHAEPRLDDRSFDACLLKGRYFSI
jgi:hypothetical protein